MSDPNFGPLGGLVRRCERRRRPAKVMVLGPNSSGKTLSAIRLAAGLVGEGGTIALLSCGEAAAEELYAEWATFYHVDALAPATVELVRKATKGGRMAWDAAGTDPRVALYAAKAMIQGVGAHGVLVVDSVSDIWEGVKARVDGMTGGDKKMNGPAWQQATPVLDQFWDVLEQATCHVIVCVRCKSESALEEREGEKVPVHYPTSPEMRERDRFRFDVRIYLDTLHRARFEGRIDALNGRTVPLLTEDVGRRFAALLDGPAAQPRLQAPEPAVEPHAPVAEEQRAPEALRERKASVHPIIPETATADVWGAYITACGLVPEGKKPLQVLASWSAPEAENRAKKLGARLARLPRDGQELADAFDGLVRDIGDQAAESMLAAMGTTDHTSLSLERLAGLCAAMLREREHKKSGKAED